MNLDLTNIFILAAVVIASGLAGMVAHAIKKWARKEIDGSPIDYLFRDHFRETVLSLGALLSAAAAALAGGLFEGMTLLQVVIAAFPYGYANDSVVNKGAQVGEIKPL